VTLEFTVRALTDTGRVREQNEDMPLDDAPLVGVADGMGGHEGGEVASRLAVETLRSWKPRLEGRAGRDAAAVLREAFAEANRIVYEKGLEDESLLGMGTTLTVGWLNSGTLSLAHVGDSRAYLLRNGELRQLTEDQTVAQEWVRRGRLSEEEAAASPHRHILLQAIGADTDKLDIETTTLSLRPGDRLLFASDGLTGMVKEHELLRDLLGRHTDPDDACRALVDAANSAGGEDNISVVIVDVSGELDARAAVDDQALEDDLDRAPPELTATRPGGRGFPRLALVVLGALVILVIMGVLFVLRPSSTAYVVAEREGDVVVLRGRPGSDVNDEASGRVVKTYGSVRADDFASTVQRELRSGIVVQSLREADRVVDSLPRQLGPDETPEPTATPTPEPSPKATATQR
jgi:serine/threonine protein phosphatase PrpC